MPAERFDFPNAQGQKLAALLDRPAGEARAYALFAHCFTCGKDIHAAKRVAEGLTALGIAVLRFDFTGLGSSDGEQRRRLLEIADKCPVHRTLKSEIDIRTVERAEA